MRPIRHVKVTLEAIGELKAKISGLEINLSVARDAETRLSAEVAIAVASDPHDVKVVL